MIKSVKVNWGEIMSLLGKRLRQARNSTGHTQDYVANMLGTTYQTISNYERGIRDPDTDSLNRLADFFNVTTDFLLGRTDDPAPQKPSYEEMVLSVKTMGDASAIIFNLHNADKIDNDEFVRLMKIAYKHLDLPPVKGAEEAAHLEHNIPGTGVFEKRSDDKDKS